MINLSVFPLFSGDGATLHDFSQENVCIIVTVIINILLTCISCIANDNLSGVCTCFMSTSVVR